MTYFEMLQKELPLFKLEETKDGNIHGVIPLDMPEIRSRKDRYKHGSIYLFVSSQMYPGKPQTFRYALCYQKTKMTPYRCKRSHEIEANKIYVSGKSLKNVVPKLITQIKQSLDINAFILK
jgi:hypothetical protein